MGKEVSVREITGREVSIREMVGKEILYGDMICNTECYIMVFQNPETETIKGQQLIL